MAFSASLSGIYVPVVTPFTESGELDLASLERLVLRLAADGAKGVVALGTTGEAASLVAEERLAVVERCASLCLREGLELVVGAGTNSTHRSIPELAELAGIPAARAALVVVPYYTRPSEQGVIAHYRQLAQSSPVPIIVYNVPHRTGRTLSASTLLELARIDNIVGTKHATGGIDGETVRFLLEKPAQFDVLVGDDLFVLPMAALGATGGILASAHFLPAGFAAVIERATSGDLAGARVLARPLSVLAEALFAEPNPSVIKGLLYKEGDIASAFTRLPIMPASPGSVDTAARLLDQARKACAEAGIPA